MYGGILMVVTFIPQPYTAHSTSRSSLETMLFVRPTRGHFSPYRVKMQASHRLQENFALADYFKSLAIYEISSRIYTIKC